jgi:YD repeat-containing protein
MPLYRFHLDVPASPEVVAERLRLVVRGKRGFWEAIGSTWKRSDPSGPPFIGSVQNLSFRLRRDTRYRNSFLPQIRGRIVPVENGARVNVVMFMHPFTLIFMLFWLGSVGYGGWKEFPAHTPGSNAVLGMFIFWLTLTIVGFFPEAVKAKRLLSAAVLNSAVNSAVNMTQQPSVQPQPEVPHFQKVFGRVLLVGVVLLVLSLAADAYTKHLRGCPAFMTALELASNSQEVKSVLGEPIQAGQFVRGRVQQNSEAGYALLSIPVRGPRAKGTLYVVANRVRNRWDLERVALWTGAQPNRLDLSPPPQAEGFHYPGLGRVYLLPLDETAASSLKDLPAYYKARLGLDVTLMPILHLGRGTVNQARKQVVAEKALDFIWRANKDIIDDLDSVVLAVTSQDLNIETLGWRFATNYRHGRFAIVSTARLHDMPWFVGTNPEVFGVRVRKMVTKNIALLHYPVELSSDATSALASAVFSGSDADEMGEDFLGQNGTWSSDATDDGPCVTITQGPGGRQSWRLDCVDDPPEDGSFETFENYTGIPLFVMARTDFSLGGEYSLSFVRKYRPQDDRSRAFGIGANDSFDIFPVGDAKTFSYVELILADGGRIHFDRVSKGSDLANAKFRTGAQMGSPFSLSSLSWNGNGWSLATIDGWTYKFPSTTPERLPQQGALVGIDVGSGHAFSIRRNSVGDLQRVQAPNGSWIEFSCDALHRITLAKDSTGRAVQYEYDAAGRLTHVHDSKNGDEFYQYDPINRMTAVLDAKGHPVLVNAYGYLGELTSQTLADNRKLLYQYGWDYNQKLASLKFTDPQGYVIEWWRGPNGFTRSLPYLPK